MVEKKHHPRKQLDTIVDQQTYYCGSECNFKWKEISSDQVKETKTVKEKTLAKEKVKGMLGKRKKHISITKLDTIVDTPHNKHIILHQYCSCFFFLLHEK